MAYALKIEGTDHYLVGFSTRVNMVHDGFQPVYGPDPSDPGMAFGPTGETKRYRSVTFDQIETVPGTRIRISIETDVDLGADIGYADVKLGDVFIVALAKDMKPYGD